MQKKILNLSRRCTILNVYVPTNCVCTNQLCMHQTMCWKLRETKLKKTERRNRQIHKYSLITQHLSTVHREIKQKKNQQEYRKLSNTVKWQDPINTDRILHPTIAAYTFFSSVQGMYIKIDHILGHKTYLHRLEELKSCSVHSLHNGIKLEISNRKISTHLEMKHHTSVVKRNVFSQKKYLENIKKI